MATNLERFVMVGTLVLVSSVAIGQLSDDDARGALSGFGFLTTHAPDVSNHVRFIADPLRRGTEVLVVKNGRRMRFDPTVGSVDRGTRESPEIAQLSSYQSTNFRDTHERAYGASN